MHLKLIDLIGRLILGLALCLSACESKPQLPKLSAWQTCEYMMGLWFDRPISEDEKAFYDSKFLDQLQQMPNFSKINKKKKELK